MTGSNKPSQVKLAFYLKKRAELEAVLQIKQKTDELNKRSNNLNEAFKTLTEKFTNAFNRTPYLNLKSNY
ncbi:hypothetical protein HPULCUR_007322 [Helicostylum pulchrum]|uniref:Uncharacterized protein n=1 Tax=Helicostylum pulchrum TaxID=562976 RepID=A0ABP9Y4H6_9FUNG